MGNRESTSSYFIAVTTPWDLGLDSIGFLNSQSLCTRVGPEIHLFQYILTNNQNSRIMYNTRGSNSELVKINLVCS